MTPDSATHFTQPELLYCYYCRHREGGNNNNVWIKKSALNCLPLNNKKVSAFDSSNSNNNNIAEERSAKGQHLLLLNTLNWYWQHFIYCDFFNYSVHYVVTVEGLLLSAFRHCKWSSSISLFHSHLLQLVPKLPFLPSQGLPLFFFPGSSMFIACLPT